MFDYRWNCLWKVKQPTVFKAKFSNRVFIYLKNLFSSSTMLSAIEEGVSISIPLSISQNIPTNKVMIDI